LPSYTSWQIVSSTGIGRDFVGFIVLKSTKICFCQFSGTVNPAYYSKYPDLVFYSYVWAVPCCDVVTLCYIAADVTNAEFICGKAEDVLPSLMWRLSGQEVIVVVDPPRAGLRVFHFMLSLAFV